MPIAARLARSLLRPAARPGPAQRGLVTGPPQDPLGPAGRGSSPARLLGGGPPVWEPLLRPRFRRGGRCPGSSRGGRRCPGSAARGGAAAEDGGGGASAEAGAARRRRGRRQLPGLRRGHHGTAGPHPAGDRGAEPAGVGAAGAGRALQGVRAGRPRLPAEDQGPAPEVLLHPQDAAGRELLLPRLRLRAPRGPAGGRPGAAAVQGDLGAQQGRAGGAGLHRVHDRGLPQHVHGADRARGAPRAAARAAGGLQRAGHVGLPGGLPAPAHLGLPPAPPPLLRAVPRGRPQHQGVLPAGGGAHVQGERPHPHHRPGAGAAGAGAGGVHGPGRGRRHQPPRLPRGLPAPRLPPLPPRPLRHPLQVSRPRGSLARASHEPRGSLARAS